MKKNQSLAFMALVLMMGCSKDYLTSTERNAAASEKNNLAAAVGARQNPPSNGINSITFYSNSISNKVFFEQVCLPSGKYLLKQGNFTGNLSGFGKLNTSLSTYEFVSCKELPIDPPNSGEPLMYAMVAKGKLALTTRDYCNITITGNIYPWYYTEFGFYGGVFIGNAITESGVGKLKGMNNRSFQVYGGKQTEPSINLETGTITLRFNEK